MIRAFWIIGSWLGHPVPQNARADLLGHVIDLRSDDTSRRLYQTRLEQPLHSDSCDIVGLLCLRAAKQGGESVIASSAHIYNVLKREQPVALAALQSEFPCDRFGEIPAGKKLWYKLRVFNEIWCRGRYRRLILSRKPMSKVIWRILIRARIFKQ